MVSQGNRLLAGVTVPVVSPMTPDGHLDGDGAGEFFAALARAGVRKVLLLGSNGEGPLVSDADLADSLAELIRTWRDAAGDDAVATVNVTAPGTLQALQRGRLARDAGADAIVLSPPLYFIHSDTEIAGHYAAFEQLALPVIAYNTPRYANPLNTSTARAVLGMPHVVGVKDSSGDLAFLRELVAIAAQLDDVAVSQGAETQLVAGLDAGAQGIVPGVANVAPALSLELFRSWQAGDRLTAESAQRTVSELTQMHSIHRGAAAVKQMLALAGLLAPHVTPPLLPCDESEHEQFRVFADRFASVLVHGVMA